MAADRPVGYQRLAESVLRYLCRCRIWCHDVTEVAIKGGHTCHQRVPGVMGAQPECIELQVRRVVVWIVTVGCPSPIDSVWLPRPEVTEPVLDD